MLAIAGMAMMLIFAVGVKASQAGFRLGRSALGVADREVADDSFRSLVAGLMIAPSPADPVRLHLAPFDGRADGFEGGAVLGRGGVCAGGGPVQPLQVRVERTATGDLVTCRTPQGRAVLFDLEGQRAGFAYSEDGRSWSDHWTDRPAFIAANTVAAQRRSRGLYVRLASTDGRFEIVAQAPANRPEVFAEAPLAQAATQ